MPSMVCRGRKMEGNGSLLFLCHPDYCVILTTVEHIAFTGVFLTVTSFSSSVAAIHMKDCISQYRNCKLFMHYLNGCQSQCCPCSSNELWFVIIYIWSLPLLQGNVFYSLGDSQNMQQPLRGEKHVIWVLGWLFLTYNLFTLTTLFSN